MNKQEVAFLKKSSAKDFCELAPVPPRQPVMAAKAAIHALRSISVLLDVTFLGRQKGVDGRCRGHDGLRAREGQHA